MRVALGKGESLGTSPGLDGRTAATLRGRSSLGHRPELDGLRAIAVAMVLLYHVGEVLWPARRTLLLQGGALGVDLFFVLSGFLITSLLLAERERRGRVDLAAFARRRGLRLLPGMLALFAVVLVVALTVKGWYDVGQVISTAGWSLSFTANWAVADGRPYVIGHLWTISVEGQFYLVWAIAVVVAVRFRHALLLLGATATAVIAAVALWRYGQVEGGANLFFLYGETPARFDAPMIGALAAVAMAAGLFDRLRGLAAAAVAVAGLAVVLVAAAVLQPLDPELYRGVFTLVAVAAACAVVGAVRAADVWPVRLLATWPLVLVGTVSYSLYLWHLPIYQWTARLAPGWWAPARALVAVLATVVAAALSYRYVERPFLSRRHRRAEEQGDTAEPAQAAEPAEATEAEQAVEPADATGAEPQPAVAMAKQRSSSAPNA